MTFAVACAAACMLPAPALARDVVVESFDGTDILAHFLPAPAAGKKPTIMVGHGFGGQGERNPDASGIKRLLNAGFNVLTWDARGFGSSGGQVEIDSPEYEGRD